MFRLTRRKFLVTTTAAALTPLPALALSESAAGSLVQTLVDKINAVIDSGKSETAMYSEFEKIFRTYADITYVAAYALGADARTASASQKKAFTDAFTGYVSRKYGKRFREFIGGRLEMDRVKAVKNYLEVRTIAHLRGQSLFDITFFVSDRTGKPLFFNMYIEGINMLLTERTEVGAMLDRNRGDLNKTIADLRKAG